MTAVKTYIPLLMIGLILTGCGGETTPTMQKATPAAQPASAPARPPDENAAGDAVRKVIEAQSTYFKVNRRYALTFDELIEARMLTSEPSAAQSGYDFKLRPAADARTYKLSVVPSDSKAAATARHFFTDQTGVIHADTGKEATADSPVVK
jgi:hypothetical protein